MVVKQLLQSAFHYYLNCCLAPLDECATAAEVYDCNNKKNPELTQAVITLYNSSSPASANVKMFNF
jgi:hypothetical protein